MRQTIFFKMNNFILKVGFGSFAIIILLFHPEVGRAQSCSYSLSMHDSYGDGWNGGYLAVFINSVFQSNHSALNHGSTDSIQVNSGDILQLIYTAGAYENENTYQLYDHSWNLLFDDGPNPQTGSVFSTTADCSTPVIPGGNPCTAIHIDTGQCILYSNSTAAGTGMNAGCANYTGGDVWFEMLVPPSGNIRFVTDSGSINDTGLAIWGDSICNNLHAIACDDDGGPGYFSQILMNDLIPGQKIFIQVWGYNGAAGSFRLCAYDMGTIILDSTELPVVMINTLGQTIVNDVKINALMDIKYYGPNSMTRVSDSSNIYSGNIGIEIRGASSAAYPQRPYGLETRTNSGGNNNVSILGMPAENDWVLISNYNDRSLIRNTLSYKLFGEMGNYSPRMRLCEVLIDSSYKGIYVMGEKIKRDNNRVNIAKLDIADSLGDQLSGGYILQQNYWDASNSFLSNFSPIDHPGFDVHFVYEFPASDIITTPQKIYIASYVDSLETALYSPDFNSPVIGYRKFLDVKSFVDYFLINELSRNNDGFKKSVFFHKDKYSNGGKLKAGPAWDFDWAWKDLNTCSLFSNTDGSGWAYLINDCPTDNYSCGWYVRLLQDSNFRNELRCIYEGYRQNILDTVSIFSYIDSVRILVQHAQVRHFQKWPILGFSGPAPEVSPIALTYNDELDTLKVWIRKRITWLDANIPGLCAPVSSDGSLVESANALSCYPNPSSGIFHFEGFLEGNSSLQMIVYDVTGKIINTLALSSGNVKFDYEVKSKGVYYYAVRNSSEIIKYGKLIVL